MKPDLLVVGGGSGGFGAALAAARAGAKVLLVEAAPVLGGTSTLAGVNTWEPGICGPGFSRELYEMLAVIPDAVGMSRTTKFYSPERPWGLSQIQPGIKYEASLRRSGVPAEQWTRVTFEPYEMAKAMATLLEIAGVSVRLKTKCVDVEVEGELIRRVTLVSAGVEWSIEPRFVVDATAGLFVARAAGCRTVIGAEARSQYGEPSAPDEAQLVLNGVSRCFRVEKNPVDSIELREDDDSAEPWPAVVNMTEYPNGDLNMNPLPIMEGVEWHRLMEEGRGEAEAECERRVRGLWRWLREFEDFRGWRLKEIFPMDGVREGHRLVGRRVLTETDVRAGWQGQPDASRVIALADHALDVHGEGGLCRELSGPYGIPYECLLPKEFANLAVACRAASFSHLAASSCRLSRTMMDLGHAAGRAVACAVRNGRWLPEVDVAVLRMGLMWDGLELEPKRFRCESGVNGPEGEPIF